MDTDAEGCYASLYFFIQISGYINCSNFSHHFASILHIVCYIGYSANIFLDFQRKKGYNEERKYPKIYMVLYTEE